MKTHDTTSSKNQIWRPLTSFLYFGQFGLNYLLSAHFMWTYMAHLEKLKVRNYGGDQ